ncbi:hypothetical protein EVAR_22447_1 [Eumeta japonica]|uniref:Uncharacterized protein n=1 Tax=Eumeta variegata TaxID=151549 RepID=A0A4C1VF81_EUMVA|nr:hypothetical protein EVAR_22447_1 [Eumeta japonica]
MMETNGTNNVEWFSRAPPVIYMGHRRFELSNTGYGLEAGVAAGDTSGEMKSDLCLKKYKPTIRVGVQLCFFVRPEFFRIQFYFAP